MSASEWREKSEEKSKQVLTQLEGENHSGWPVSHVLLWADSDARNRAVRAPAPEAAAGSRSQGAHAAGVTEPALLLQSPPVLSPETDVNREETVS